MHISSTYHVQIPDQDLTDDIRQFLLAGAPGTSAAGPAQRVGARWLIAQRLPLRDAQTLRRQLQALGLLAEVNPDEGARLSGQVGTSTSADIGAGSVAEEDPWRAILGVSIDDASDAPSRASPSTADVAPEGGDALLWPAASTPDDDAPPPLTSDSLPMTPRPLADAAIPSAAPRALAQAVTSPARALPQASPLTAFNAPAPRRDPAPRRREADDDSSDDARAPWMRDSLPDRRRGLALLGGLGAALLLLAYILGTSPDVSPVIVSADNPHEHDEDPLDLTDPQAPEVDALASQPPTQPPTQPALDGTRPRVNPPLDSQTQAERRAQMQRANVFFLEAEPLCESGYTSRCIPLLEQVITLDPTRRRAYELLARARMHPSTPDIDLDPDPDSDPDSDQEREHAVPDIPPPLLDLSLDEPANGNP